MLTTLSRLGHEQRPMATSGTATYNRVDEMLNAGLEGCDELSGRSWTTFSDSGT